MLEGIQRFKALPDGRPALLHLFAEYPKIEAFPLMQRAIRDWIMEFDLQANPQENIQMMQTLCLLNDPASIEKALYFAVKVFMCEVKLGKKNVEVLMEKVHKMNSFHLSLITLEMLGHENMAGENLKEKLPEFITQFLHILLFQSRQLKDPKDISVAFRFFYNLFPKSTRDHELTTNFVNSVLALPNSTKVHIDNFINLLAALDTQSSEQARKFYELRKVPHTPKPGKPRDNLFQFLLTLIERYLMQDMEFIDSSHERLDTVFNELADLCEFFPEMREVLVVLLVKFHHLKLASGYDLSGPFFERKKQLVQLLQTRTKIWSAIDYTILGLFLADKKLVEYKPVDIEHLYASYIAASQFFTKHPAAIAFHHYIEVLKIGLYSFPLFEPNQIEQLLSPLV